MASKKRIILTSILNVLGIVVVGTTIVASSLFSPILTLTLGSIGESSLENKKYSVYSSDEEIQKAREDMSYEVMGESAVLLRNENNALPLNKTAKISIFGQHAHEILASGSGSGSIGDPTKNLKEVLVDSGFSVNETLWNFYLGNGVASLGHGPALAGGQSTTDWSINECPKDKYSDDVITSFNSYNDAAVVVLSRTGGEGGDLPTDMSPYGGDSSQHYLELSKEEKDLLSFVTAKFDKVIVLLNTNNPMELGFLEEYQIDSCLYIGGVGMAGLNAVGDLLNGTITPSGHLADTYLYNNRLAPSYQNFGDFSYTNNNNYHYVSYREGIYVGYRYFETRYADTVMNKANVGSYNYDTTVCYPFGYGLSYTSFKWSNFKVDYDATNDEFTISVTVKNVGEKSGKDVVELYYEAPYTDDAIEKSAVSLGGFSKTSLLEPNQEETVSIKMPRKQLTSYDDKNDKTYVLDKGDYLLTVAGNAHEAIYNILDVLGYNTNGSSLVETYSVAQKDATTYSTDENTNTAISNIFDDASYDGFTTLKRTNWKAVEEGIKDSNLVLSNEDLAQAQKTGKEASKNPYLNQTVSSITTNNQNSSLELKDMIDVDYDDPKWDEIVSRIKKSDLQSLYYGAGYATKAIDYIGKPKCVDTDGPAGLQSFVGGANAISAYGYPTETLLACSWNTDLANRFGQMVGEDSLRGGANGWYAPGMDTHRSAFGGRNFEYYSEDGLVAGKIGSNVVSGAQSKGLYCFIKHFALNDQDTNRGTTLHTWASEQSMREIYLRPFEISVKEGKALALMTSLNCIGVTPAVGDYDLITRLLKNEWGFKGMVITDYLSFDENLIMDVLYAGGDAMLSTYGTMSDKSNETYAQLQRAAKNILYTVSRSNAMYSLSDGGSVSSGFPVYKVIFIAVDVLIGCGLIVLDTFFVLNEIKKKKAQ